MSQPGATPPFGEGSGGVFVALNTPLTKSPEKNTTSTNNNSNTNNGNNNSNDSSSMVYINLPPSSPSNPQTNNTTNITQVPLYPTLNNTNQQQNNLSNPVNILPSVPSQLTERINRGTRTNTSISTFSNNDNLYDSIESVKTSFWKRVYRVLQVDSGARKLLLMAIVMLLLGVVELMWGIVIDNLALFAASFHSFYDGIALSIGLISNIVAKQKPSHSYSYGMERFEIVLTFSNGALLIFVGLYVGFESVEHLFELPEHVTTDKLALIGIISLIIHVIAIVLFKEQVHMRSESAIEPKRSGIESLITYAFLDAAPSIAVIVSSSVIHLNGWTWSDALVSLMIAGVFLYNALPICVKTARVLLQSVPLSIKDLLDKSLRDASTVDGVLEVKQNKVHFWTYSPGVYVGTLQVRVRADSDEQKVLSDIENIFSPIIQHLTIQIIKGD